MAVICRSYTDEAEAHRVVEALLAAGVPGDRVRVLMGEQERDARLEPEGEFAGRTAPDDIVGEFAGQGHERSEGAGTFAGSAAKQREGSFGDVDRETVTSYPGGVQREHIAGHEQLRKLLIDAGLSKADADHDVEALHHGRILVLADVGDRPVEELEQAFAA